MATWQFDFRFLPRTNVERHFGTIPLTITMERFERVSWWEGYDLPHHFADELSRLLPKAPSWSTEIDKWGTEDSDRVDVVWANGQLEDLFVRFDARGMSFAFLNGLLELGRKYDLLLLTEDSHVLRPLFKELLSAIRRSASFKFVRDPEAFLSEIAKP